MQDVTAFCLVLCRFGEYELHDLVELDQQTAGVLVQADAETCQVLTNRNAVSHTLPVLTANAIHAYLSCVVD